MTKIQSMTLAAFLAFIATPAVYVQAEELPAEQASDYTAIAPENMTDTAAQTAEMIVQRWPERVQRLAKAMTEKYGVLSAFSDKELVWANHAPWKRIILHRNGVTPSQIGKAVAAGDKDHLEQVISYRVPEDKIADLKKFDRRIKVNRAAGELSSVADSESMNCLNLNLADDIVKGQRRVQDARSFALKTKMLEQTGKTSPYLEGIVFKLDEIDVDQDVSADPRLQTIPENVPVPNGGE